MLEFEYVKDKDVSYPLKADCYCGKTSYLGHKTVNDSSAGVKVRVTEVPVYGCSEEHNDIDRRTRVRLKEQMAEYVRTSRS